VCHSNLSEPAQGVCWLALLQFGWWRNNNPFRGLCWQEIGIVVLVGAAIAITAVIVIVAIVSSFPISDASKCKVLFGLGLASLFAGYVLTLKRIPPKTQQRTPPTVKPITHSGDVCNGSNEINRKFFHVPNIPNKATAISSAPTKNRTKTSSALPILTSFHRYLIRVLHNVL
jgi:hypothetical protein